MNLGPQRIAAKRGSIFSLQQCSGGTVSSRCSLVISIHLHRFGCCDEDHAFVCPAAVERCWRMHQTGTRGVLAFPPKWEQAAHCLTLGVPSSLEDPYRSAQDAVRDCLAYPHEPRPASYAMVLGAVLF